MRSGAGGEPLDVERAVAPASSNPGPTGRLPVVASTVRLPADPTGAALAGVLRRLRAAACSGGDVVVDVRAVQRSSPGLRRVLHVLRRETERRGCSWRYRGRLPAPPLHPDGRGPR